MISLVLGEEEEGFTCWNVRHSKDGKQAHDSYRRLKLCMFTNFRIAKEDMHGAVYPSFRELFAFRRSNMFGRILFIVEISFHKQET